MTCLLVFLFFLSGPGLLWAEKPVEVYVNGVRYTSVDAYKASKDRLKPVVPRTIIIRKEPSISPRTRQALENISLERGISRVVADFDQDWNNPVPKFTINADELADRIQTLVADRKEPILVVSEPDKVRVAVQEDNP